MSPFSVSFILEIIKFGLDFDRTIEPGSSIMSAGIRMIQTTWNSDPRLTKRDRLLFYKENL